MKIRKQVYELSPADLEKYPVWEFCLDEEGEEGQDEATVKPREDLKIVDPGEGMFVVKTEFVANDGTKFLGYSTPQQEYDLGFIQPIIVTESGQINFWCGMFEPKKEKTQESYTKLGKDSEMLFPITFRALVPTKGVTLEGSIPAFLYRPDEEVKEIK